MIQATDVELGDILKFKKKHPCGCFTWKVIRIGVDYKLECTNCKRIIMLSRLEALKKATLLIKKEKA